MRFAAVVREFLRSPPACFAAGSALGTWLRLYSYAAEIEQGGTIPGCASYSDREWLALAQVTKGEVDETVVAGLCDRRDPDLLVLGYDRGAAQKVRAARENGRGGGRPPRRPKGGTGKPNAKPSDNPGVKRNGTQVEPPIPSSLVSSSRLSPNPEGIGREGGSGAAPPPHISSIGAREGEPAVELAVGVFRDAYRHVRKAEPPPVDALDLNRYGAELASMDPEELQWLARWFFGRDGKRRGDDFWRERGWSLHVFVTQGIPAAQAALAAKPAQDFRYGHVRAESQVHTVSGVCDLGTGAVTPFRPVAEPVASAANPPGERTEQPESSPPPVATLPRLSAVSELVRQHDQQAEEHRRRREDLDRQARVKIREFEARLTAKPPLVEGTASGGNGSEIVESPRRRRDQSTGYAEPPPPGTVYPSGKVQLR